MFTRQQKRNSNVRLNLLPDVVTAWVMPNVKRYSGKPLELDRVFQICRHEESADSIRPMVSQTLAYVYMEMLEESEDSLFKFAEMWNTER